MGEMCLTTVTVLSVMITLAAPEYLYHARIVSIFVSKPELPISLDVVQLVIEMAGKEANRRFPRIKFEVEFRNSSSNCSANFAGVFAAEEYYLRKVTAFVGPACSLALDPVGRMASYWNVPIYTAGGIDASFSDKEVFSTLTRMTFSLDRVADWFVLILQKFDWHHIFILVDDSDLGNVLIKRSLLKALRYQPQIFLTVKEYISHNSNIGNLLQEGSKEARVFLLLTEGESLRNIMLKAFDLGMGNGEYVFFSYELLKNDMRKGDFSWYRKNDKRNKDARKMFEALMIIAIRVPTSLEYKAFISNVIQSSKTNPGRYKNEIHEDMINPIVSAFYDCVIMYAWSLNKTLEEGEDPADGLRMVRRLWNTTFLGGLTGDIFINENGDREADYTLNDLDPDTGLMIPVATYFGARRRYEMVRGNRIHWPGNAYGPPPDVPECGFLGDAPQCQPGNVKFPFWIIVFLACSIVIFFASGFFLYRKMMMENDLADQWWKIHWEDVMFPENLARKSTASLRFSDDGVSSNSTRPSTSLSLLHEVVTSGMKIGLYKGIKVAVKMLDMKRVNINRELLMDLKQMRDVTHENLIRFVGLCIDEPNISIFTEHSPRGTLMDMLANDAMNMDWICRYSIITDIVEGMTFLHTSDFQYHGKLKSSNCLIDGRFMVKLSEYGMRSLYNQMPSDEINQRIFFWTAPEHLRDKSFVASKKGDIYSFAIILQEVITRNGPYEFSDMQMKSGRLLEPDEILNKIRLGTTPPFRPEVDATDCQPELIRLMKCCWAENPAERPTFPEIKSKIRKITKGVSSHNFLDNLLSRMEQYANNLEQLVEEKTQSLIDEKKKTDELLYQLLPKFIAEELKMGNHVKPEVYDSVTIFFSDIVGFTSLCAESTPMQVVDLLNDLYTCFDATIDLYNVYKVETIGDAYMVASGLPIKIGDEHAREIARMSLALIKTLENFKIRHKPDKKLKLRIGAHSGPCVAGVVGLKMPKYCLFGDTVNTASRMESTGEALKIHISMNTKRILDTFGTFRISKRGDIDIKGKGIMTTFWLEGENE